MNDEMEIPVSFTLPPLQASDYGICHVDYVLYDAENKLIQLPVESDTGRFAVYHVTDPYTSNRKVNAWITAKDEVLYFSEHAELTFHLKNNTDQPQEIELQYSWNHEDSGNYIQTVTIPGGEQLDLEFSAQAPGSLSSAEFFSDGSAGMRFWLWYRNPQSSVFGYSKAFKGLIFKTCGTRSGIVHFQPSEVMVGQPFSYTVEVKNESETALGDTAVSVYIEKLQWPGNTYSEAKKIYETTKNIAGGENFQTLSQNVEDLEFFYRRA